MSEQQKYYAVWQLDAHPVCQVASGWAEICYLKSKHTVVKFKGFGSSVYAKKYADDQCKKLKEKMDSERMFESMLSESERCPLCGGAFHRAKELTAVLHHKVGCLMSTVDNAFDESMVCEWNERLREWHATTGNTSSTTER